VIVGENYFLDIAPVLPRILLARCVDVFVEDLFMSFRFVSFRFVSLSQGKPSTLWDVFFDILMTSMGALALGSTFRNLNRSLNTYVPCINNDN